MRFDRTITRAHTHTHRTYVIHVYRNSRTTTTTTSASKCKNAQPKQKQTIYFVVFNKIYYIDDVGAEIYYQNENHRIEKYVYYVCDVFG